MKVPRPCSHVQVEVRGTFETGKALGSGLCCEERKKSYHTFADWPSITRRLVFRNLISTSQKTLRPHTKTVLLREIIYYDNRMKHIL
jgi:hypothetical protein